MRSSGRCPRWRAVLGESEMMQLLKQHTFEVVVGVASRQLILGAQNVGRGLLGKMARDEIGSLGALCERGRKQFGKADFRKFAGSGYQIATKPQREPNASFTQV